MAGGRLSQLPSERWPRGRAAILLATPFSGPLCLPEVLAQVDLWPCAARSVFSAKTCAAAIWVYIRGWLEFYEQKADAERIIRDGDAEGWTFPQGGWLDAACYARAVRSEHEVLDLIRKIAALPAADEDDDRVCGLFLVIGRAPERYDYLWR